ncbi:EF-hand domain-containing protein [Roseomonas sp. GC11]|uniref:EF-hand domain-containing protein n=1 Tax=Roseomonas sp. GC11 TaxID=2950546 RepID=UPI00210BEAD4|nr:EF-hand domain-containing protein [Roseomonas sp. GC11]MCQ4159304.1 EF-hand domain-containing protein [Roseomonas sp. GC11]
MNRSLGAGLLGVALLASGLPALSQSALAQPAPAQPAQAQPAPQAAPAPAPQGRHRPAGPPRLLQMADADHDGRITETEALNALSARFAEADADHDGNLTLDELHAFLRQQWEARRPAGERRAPPEAMRHRMAERVDGLFRAADANRDGKVTLDEARAVALALFRATDRNNDGVLEASELRGPHGHGPAGGRPPRGEVPAPL